MSVSKFPLPNLASDNWVEVATSSPSGVTSVDFTSISLTYSKLLVYINVGYSSGSGFPSIKINGATSNYLAFLKYISSSHTSSGAFDATANFPLGQGGSGIGAARAMAVIENANTTGTKILSGYGYTPSAGASGYSWLSEVNGLYLATAGATQVTVEGGGTMNSGTVTLYGVSL